MKLAGLFSGIGGFECAFEAAGHESALLAEIDPLARSVLDARFETATVCEDVRQIDALPVSVDLVSAGFPCQDLSMAGSKSGMSGKKSGVVDELYRLISPTGIRTVLIENVYFMLHLDRGAAMASLVDSLEGLGFTWAYRVLDTAGFGLPQRRRRVYLIASRDFDPASVLLSSDEESHGTGPIEGDVPIGFYWTEGRSGTGFTRDAVPPIKAGSTLGIPSAPAVAFAGDRIETPSVRAALRLQGFPSDWLDERDQSIQERYLWRLVGNAVSVPVARWVVDRIDRASTPENLALAPDVESVRLPKGHLWPNAAWGRKGRRFGATLDEKPASVSWRSIEEFRDDTWHELSKRALAGFSSRLEKGRLRSPPGFKDLLVRVASRYEEQAA